MGINIIAEHRTKAGRLEDLIALLRTDFLNCSRRAEQRTRMVNTGQHSSLSFGIERMA
jgi:hypothetical protein